MRPVSWRAATVIRTNEAMEAIIQPVAWSAGWLGGEDVGLKRQQPTNMRGDQHDEEAEPHIVFGIPGVGADRSYPVNQAWLDVEAALAQAQAEAGIISAHAAEETTRKARLALLDRQAIRRGSSVLRAAWRRSWSWTGPLNAMLQEKTSTGRDDRQRHPDRTDELLHASSDDSSELADAARGPGCGRARQGHAPARTHARSMRRP